MLKKKINNDSLTSKGRKKLPDEDVRKFATQLALKSAIGQAQFSPTTRIKILKYLSHTGRDNIRGIADSIGVKRSNVIERLKMMEKEGQVVGKLVNELTPLGKYTKIHWYQITEKGLEFLEKYKEETKDLIL